MNNKALCISLLTLALLVTFYGCSMTETEPTPSTVTEVKRGNKYGTMKEAKECMVKGDEKRGFEIYRYHAYELQNPKALLNLALCYDYGFGCKTDNNKAYELYMKVLTKGETGAYHHLGNLFMSELSGTMDCTAEVVTCNGTVPSAVYWHVKSLETGNKKSIKKIMSFYFNSPTELYAWGMLAQHLKMDVSFFQSTMDKLASTSPKQFSQANQWGAELIEKYGNL